MGAFVLAPAYGFWLRLMAFGRKLAYIKNFVDKDQKVWQGGGERNPPPEAPHLVVTSPEIDAPL